jgi:hypothetical protein
MGVLGTLGSVRFPADCFAGRDIHKSSKAIMGQIRLDDYIHLIIYIEHSD